MIKAIATDLDGTLFYPKTKSKLITKYNKLFLRSFIDNGNEVIAVTGRNITMKQKIEKAINRKDSISFIGCNGAAVYHKDELLYTHPIDKSFAKDLYQKMMEDKTVKTFFFFCDDGFMYIDLSHLGNILYKMAPVAFKTQGAYYEPCKFGKKNIDSMFNNDNIHILKIMPTFSIHSKGLEAELRALEVRKELRKIYPEYTIVTSNTAIEITAPGVNKGVALEFLLNYLHLDKDEVAVCGDSGNDIPMFESFDNSFVMGHARDEVKPFAKNEISKFHHLSDYIENKSE